MRSEALIVTLSMALFLQGCATYSFAPPKVELRHLTRDDETFNLRCGIGRANNNTKILRNIKGAEHLTDNFLYAYRCAERQVANGRQHFEVPAMIVGLGGAVAAAAGAPAAVALGTGATVAALNGGKAYYAPKDKLPIFAASVDALVCVKNESLGVDSYGSTLISTTNAATGAAASDADESQDQTKTKDGSKDNKSDPASKTVAAQQAALNQSAIVKATADATSRTGVAARGGAQIAISTSKQYFEMVEAALLSIENIAAQRLSSVGSYSSDAIISEFKTLTQQQASADAQAPALQAQAITQSAPVTSVAAASEAATASITANAQATDNGSGSTPAAITPVAPEAKTKAVAVATKAAEEARDAIIDDVRPVTIRNVTVMATPEALSPVASDNSLVSDAMLKILKDSNNVLVLDKTKSLAVQPLSAKQVAIASVLLTIAQLQPKLDACILRAKL